MINRQKETVTISLNSFLFNAGIVGMLRILVDSGKIKISDIPNSSSIELPLSVFDNFEENYIDSMVNRYENVSNFLNYSRKFRIFDRNNCESVINILTDLTELMKRNSALHVFGLMPDEFFSNYGENLEYKNKVSCSIDIQKDISKSLAEYKKKDISEVKKQEIISILLVKYEKLLIEVERNKRWFIMKDVAFKLIKNFWGNKSFLSGSNFDIPMDVSYKESFIDSLHWFKESNIKNEKYRCLDCGDVFEKLGGKFKDGEGKISNYTWIVDKGIDSKRKTSVFWNFVPDDYMCPICAIVYSCAPLGFNVYAEKGFNAFFINQNASIKSIWSINQGLKIQADEEVSSGNTSRNLFDLYLNSLKDEGIEHNFKSFQTIQRTSDKYAIKTIGEYQIELFRIFNSEISNIKNRYIKLKNGEFYSFYDEVVMSILDGKALYPIINKAIRHYLSEDKYPPYYIKDLLLIQNYINLKRKNKGVNLEMKKSSEKDLYMIAGFGSRMKEKLVQSSAENKVKGFIYRLESSVRSNNRNRFISELTRIHTSYSVPLPMKLVEVLRADVDFRNMANAYIIGLITENKTKKEDNSNEE